MKDKIGFIGLGQCGGNIASELEKLGFKTYYINTSKEDLSTLSGESRNRFHIPDAEGCNHNRSKAVGYVKKYYKQILSQIGQTFADKEIIYFVFSAGGGTGGGAGPVLLEMATKAFPNKVFSFVTVLPSSNESVKIQTNAYKCMTEVSRIENIGASFVLDNDKADKFAINKGFAKLFDEMLNMTNYISTKGNIDVAEIKEILSTRGCAIITTSNSADGLIYPVIIRSWENNIFADLEKDKKVVYMGLSLAGDVDINNLTNVVGVPYDIFTNYNDTGINITVLSGLSFPTTRVKAIKSLIDSNKEKILNVVENSKNTTIEHELDWDIELDNSNRISNNTANMELNFDLEEIFKKYN